MNRIYAFTSSSLSAHHLDWNLVRAFLAVIDYGSLTAAANMLGASQSTLSRQITELESVVGVALFERIARGLCVTAAGTALIEPARQMQMAAQSLSLRVLGQAQELVGTVRIAVSEMVAAYLLPETIAELRSAHPEIELELVVSNHNENLLERQADIALRHVRPSQTALIARHVGDLDMGFFAHADYVARMGGSIEPDRLDQYEWIGYDRSDLLVRGFNAAGRPVTRTFFGVRCDNHIIGWQLALHGAGLAFAPVSIARRYPQMRRALPDIAVPGLPVWVTAHRELRDSRRIQLVFQWLAAGIAPMTGAPSGKD